MKREIKFRAYHKQRKEMLPTVDIEYLLTKGSLISDYKDFVENIIIFDNRIDHKSNFEIQSCSFFIRNYTNAKE